MTRRWSKLRDVEFALALSVDKGQRYQRRLIPVDPEGTDDYRVEDGLPVTRKVARWKVDEWSAGEGNDKWVRGDKMYRQSDTARPLRRGEGVVLGPPETRGTWQGNPLTEAFALAHFQSAVATAKDDGNYYAFNGTTATSQGVIGSTSPVVSIAVPGDNYVYTAHQDKSVRRKNLSGGNNEVLAAAVNANVPRLYAWGGALWMLDGNDLYEVTSGDPGSRTLRADIPGDYNLPNGDYGHHITASERGLIWLQQTDDRQVDIWEYNVYADSQVRLGRLPAGMIAGSILYHNGFVFVGGVFGGSESFIYYQRGAQKGVLGPIRSDGDTAEQPRLAGAWGEEVLFFCFRKLWAYVPSTGGVYQLHDTGLTVNPIQALCSNGFVYATYPSGADEGEISVFDLSKYAATGSLDSGRHDFAYPGMKKMLVDVIVETDPLPADTEVEVWVSADRGAFTQLTSAAHDSTDDVTTTFVASTTTTKIFGREFEVRVVLNSSDPDVSPTVRSVTARAAGAAWEEEWVMAIDCDTAKVGGAQDSARVIQALRTLPSWGLVDFVNGFETNEYDEPQTKVVTIEDVVLPDVESDGPAVATVRVRARDLREMNVFEADAL